MEAAHILRMRRFADHLMSDNLSKDYKNLDFLKFTKENQLIFWDDKWYQLFPWFEEELDFVFPADFHRNYRGHVTYTRNPRTTVTYVLPEFFAINTSAYLHCFAVGRQSIEFGRYRMTIASTPKHCGRILHQFLHNTIRMQEMEHSIIERRVIIEKVGKKSPENIIRLLNENYLQE